VIPNQKIAWCKKMDCRTDKKQCKRCDEGGDTPEKRQKCADSNVELRDKK
jgi:hypothetical protein